MKKTIVLAGLLAVSTAALAEPVNPINPRPIVKLYGLGAFYEYLCEDVLEGLYVNSNPTFMQAWECTGDLKWCNLKPNAPICEDR